MEGICNSFQGRLGQLEAEMRPMKMMSQKLSVARRHVTEAVEEMEKVNEYFTLEAEKRDAIARGVRGGGPARLAEYADDVRRVLEAMAFFRALPSLRSQGTALSGLTALCNTAAAECLEEYGRLMRAVGPSVQFNAAADAYEPVAPLSEAGAAGLAAVQGALELLEKRSALRQAYASARRVTVAATLRAWSEKFEPAPAVAGRGAPAADKSMVVMGAARLSAYLDFAVKLVAGERLLWEQALAVNPLRHRDIAAEEAFLTVVSSVVDKLVRDVDVGVQDALQELKSAQGEIGGASRARRVEGMVLLLEVGDTLNRGTALLLRVLRMGGAEDDNLLTNSLSSVQARLCRTALQSCLDLVDAVQSDPCGKRNVPENASVHVLTSNTLRAIKRITPFREGYETLAQPRAAGVRLPWDSEGATPPPQTSSTRTLQRDGAPPVDAEHSEAARQCPRFAAFVNHLVARLLENLLEKAKAYPTGRADEARRQLFLLNNANYLLTNARAANAPQSSSGPAGVLHSSSARADAIVTIFRPDSPRSSAHARLGSGGGGGGGGAHDVLSPRTLRRNIAVDTFFSGSHRQGLDDEGPPLSVAHFLTSATQRTLDNLIREKASTQSAARLRTGGRGVMTYCATLFDPLAEAVADDVGALEYGGRGKLLSLECGRLIKTKFSTFNEAWDQLHTSQRGLNVSDPDIRTLLMEEARDRVLGPYRKLYDTYKDVPFSKKHQSEYLKYPPEAVDRGIEGLFQG
ncbi:Cullin repeat-like-containing domain protein [Tribonema minus]|uniref:Exocyst subunit Exo70 family protein n=1 Tax=Tribonema minus TaxID=303371 RepID=A0A835YN31_9STRA|nr:Cullin repeat-like-containing domain protein [Tribonema minus]